FLLIGLLLLIIRRIKLSESEGKNTYNDWLFLWIIFGVALTGMSLVFLRMAELVYVAYTAYYIHLVLVFFLLWYMPFSKFAHMPYRFLGLTFLKMHGRENKPEVFAGN
ncbi:MAG: quinone-modifying oxidoreductase, subunit QmoC, partial [Bacteroidota bacterium]|nr:quinone-modifying oxidoreductase, subunit QmoC [Bacteroidota bacterium]